jgi:predicted RNA polymerase sigma factor
MRSPAPSRFSGPCLPRDQDLYTFQLVKGWALSMLDRDDEALEWLNLAAAAAPEWPLPQAMRASLLALTGQTAEAQAAFQRYLALPATTAETVEEWKQQMPPMSPGFVAYGQRVVDGLRKAGMPEK